MPIRNQFFHGKSRAAWVHDAARAMISATDPPGRYLMMKQGFVTFEQRARAQFNELAGFNFTSSELRQIWDAIARYMLRKERHLQRRFERAYAKAMLPGEPYRASEENPKIVLTDGDITTENAQGRRMVH